MFGISLLELLIVMAIILIVFGPERLPEMARSLGRLMAQLRRSTDEVKRELDQTLYAPTRGLASSITNPLQELTELKDESPYSAEQTTEESESKDSDDGNRS